MSWTITHTITDSGLTILHQINPVIISANPDNTRAESSVSTDGTDGQIISFSSALSSASYALFIMDHTGNLGIQLVSKSVSGFVINSFAVGAFDYIATLNT